MNQENRTAKFSDDRMYRYSLRIVWDDALPIAAFIGLNPSTADELKDDPTIRKCKGFARQWGCGGILMLNAFAYRATKPEDMKRASDPVGSENTVEFLSEQISGCRHVVACWGKHGHFRNRSMVLRERLSRLECLRTNKDGSPEHPLYVPYDTVRKSYVA